MSEQKQKLLSTLIVSFGAFLGFEALAYIVGLYQIKTYLQVSIYVYLFHVFWLTFLFDLHFKNRGVLATARLNHRGLKIFWEAFKDRVAHVFTWRYIRHYQNYLILPAVIYWATVILLFLNPFREGVKQFLVVASGFSMTVGYWYFKDFFSRRMEVHETGIKILNLVKLFAAFLIFSASLGATWYFGLGVKFLMLAIFAVSFLLAYQSLFQHKLLTFPMYVLLMIMAVIVSLSSYFVFKYWLINYLTGGLVILAFYNTFWGLLHHYLDQNLSKRLALEYILMMLIALSFLIASHDFTSRVG